MKHFLLFLLLVFTAFNIAYPQNASTYFPASTGYKWFYKNTPLDSNNNPINNLARYRVDSFAVVQTYQGLQASIVRVKDNLISTNQNTPYNDTNRHNFQTTNGYEYMSLSFIPDTTMLPIGFLNFLRGMQAWYNVYRFAQTVNQEYVIVQKDTTISIDTISAPIRVKLKAKRLNDETVPTVNGNYSAKKFVVTYGLYLRILILEVPIIERPDTVWLAQNVWMVKQVTPSSSVNLSQFGLPNVSIPGQKYELTLPVGIRNISSEVPERYSLSQNYPNPFNPSANIKYQIAKNSNVTLKIYDNLGKEVGILVNEELKAGTYESTFDGSRLSSGIYFYRLTAGDYSETKKMILIK